MTPPGKRGVWVAWLTASVFGAIATVTPADAATIVPYTRDVNGDGLEDVAIQRWYRDSGTSAGHSIIFGRRESGVIDARVPGPGQLWTGDPSCDVIIAGDVNGDGRADILSGCPGESAAARQDSGLATVAFGGPTTASLDARPPETAGFRVLGPAPKRGVGAWVAPAGDVNGDQRDDLLLGTSPKRPRTHPWVYVVLGQDSTADVDLAAPSSSVIAIRAPASKSGSFWELVGSGVGDVDGDGLGDLAFGQRAWPPCGGIDEDCEGRAWIVYGSDVMPSAVDLRRLGPYGSQVLNARHAVDNLGEAVAPAGDINGDGFADVLVSALVDNGTKPLVIWGGPRPLRGLVRVDDFTSRIGTGRFGSAADAVALGDVTRDGRTDFAATDGDTGSIYLVSGRSWAGELNFRKRGHRWFRRPKPELDPVPTGDVNGDGLADALVTRAHAPRGRRVDRSQLIFARPGPLSTVFGGLDAPGITVLGLRPHSRDRRP